jgi:hypothetical protein
MLNFMEKSAEAFWNAMLASSHSFEKATFYIGLHGRPGVNIVADGAVERTPARVEVLPMGLSGFVRKGDSASYRIKVGLVMKGRRCRLACKYATVGTVNPLVPF